MPSTNNLSVITIRPTARENFSPFNNLVSLHPTKLLPYEKLHFLYFWSHFCIYHTQLLFIVQFILKLGTARPGSHMRITDLQQSFHVFHLHWCKTSMSSCEDSSGHETWPELLGLLYSGPTLVQIFLPTSSNLRWRLHEWHTLKAKITAMTVATYQNTTAAWKQKTTSLNPKLLNKLT